MYTLHADAAIGVIPLTPTYIIIYHGNIALHLRLVFIHSRLFRNKTRA
jgi:hypothetical protein